MKYKTNKRSFWCEWISMHVKIIVRVKANCVLACSIICVFICVDDVFYVFSCHVAGLCVPMCRNPCLCFMHDIRVWWQSSACCLVTAFVIWEQTKEAHSTVGVCYLANTLLKPSNLHLEWMPYCQWGSIPLGQSPFTASLPPTLQNTESKTIVSRDGEASVTLIWGYGKSPYQNDKYYFARWIKETKSQRVESGEIELFL